MLTSNEMNMLVVDEMNEKPHRVIGPEADEFLKSLRKDIEKAKKERLVLDTPSEWTTHTEG